MIEHKFFDLKNYKNIEDAARELDKLMLYEGFVVLCCVGKNNNVLLLRRIIENPEPPQQIHYEQPLSPASDKRNPKKKELMFPNAIHR